MADIVGKLSPVRLGVIDAVRNGHNTVNALAQLLGVTDNAIRLQLATLERDGMLKRRGVRHSGRAGQPAAEYELTVQGESALSKAYQPALVALVQSLGDRLPDRALHGIFVDAGRRMEMGNKTPAGASLAARAEACAGMIRALGGSAKVTVNRSHALVEGTNCPLAAAVRVEPGTCFMVESLLGQHAGVKAVQRCQHGDQPRCRFELSPR